MTDHLAKGYIHYKLVNESPLGSNQLPIIGICAPNCEEWVSCMISHVKHSIITIGISHQASKDKISEIINHTSFKTLQCSSNIVPTIVLLK
jgi:long-subunit acyl-CoA synthetase (AMP-forming)